MKNCKYCLMADLAWEQVDGKWRLLTPIGLVHQCPKHPGIAARNKDADKIKPDTSNIPWSEIKITERPPSTSLAKLRQPSDFIPDFSGNDKPLRCNRCNLWIIKRKSLQSGERGIIDAYTLSKHSCRPNKVKRNYFAFPSTPLKK